MNINLGIVDIRNIVSTIESKYSISFANYSLTSFKRRLENFLKENFMTNVADFIFRISRDKALFDKFLAYILVNDTEMFRDPSFWDYLGQNYVSAISKYSKQKIWIPECTTGEELFSLMILLKEHNKTDFVDIYASSLSAKKIELTSNGIFDSKKIELFASNYSRAGGKFNLSNYYETFNNSVTFNPELISKVKFNVINLATEKFFQDFDFILYRNKLIYFNRVLENEILKKLHQSLNLGGYLCMGIKESIEDCGVFHNFYAVNKDEKVFKKVS